MKKRSLQFELTGKISIGLIIVTILVSSAIILLETIQYNNIILDSAYKNMSGTVDTIDYYFEDVKTPMVMLARNDSVVKAMEHYSDMTNREKLETNNTLKEFVQNIASFKSFISDIIILGNEGFQYNVYSNDQSKFLKKVDFSALPYFDKVNEERRRLYYIGEHETDYYQADNMRVYSVVLPVYKNQKHIGYIICDIDAAMIDDSLKKNAEGESAKIVVCDDRVHKPMAKILAKKLEEFQPMFLEEPVLCEHMECFKEIAACCNIPIATGERLYTRYDFKRLLTAGGVDIIQPDLSHAGGITEVKKIGAMAEAYDVALAPHCPLGPIALASCLQVDAVSYNGVLQEQSIGIHYNVGKSVLDYIDNKEDFRFVGGFVNLPVKAGLGVQVNKALVIEENENPHRWKNPVWRHRDGSVAEW